MVTVRVTVLGPHFTLSIDHRPSVSSSFEENGNEEATAVADAGIDVGVEDVDVAIEDGVGATGFTGSLVTRRAMMTSAMMIAATMMTAIQPLWRFGGWYWLMSGGWLMVALLYVVVDG
ncbi:hypothetical protein E5345_06005 [Propionibacterium sp. NM47_B9-13]|jgi:hypothetical protein|uniref:Uncharacterized protein n=1 Tax=Cutibacterium modestum TaxID=2559073 RepID=A0AAD1KQA3_9ACTN|nr:hypothetical protein [Cutibacterium modestum]TGY29535.1 hypothetical protein E5345_06005 [Propionibacterium sp. NM47_B9-13]AOH44704.1 hypothetical protein BCB70_00925 [Cutibacterium modestum]EFS75048.1 hypothetical protein HMPREF9621_00680 [Cutibacterium modestum HL037PA2]EFT15816.1 hypothetical protein HMPREF9622_01065 [Cutibacterium modestum HL037PA3]MCP2375136.1 hypothetical protein [Cutibacterium modestum 28N]